MTQAADQTVMDEPDKQLLNRMQFDFPVAVSPWQAMGDDLGVSGAEVLARVERLKSAGIIRQVSAIFDTKMLGYSSTLAAARVPEARLEQAAAVVSAHPGVSHNYRRDAEFNLWFTLAVPPGESLDAHMKRLAEEARFEDYLPLPTIRTFRIGVRLNLDESQAPNPNRKAKAKHHTPNAPVELSGLDKAFIRALQEDLPLVERPFDDACHTVGVGFGELSAWMNRMQDNGVMRRFAAILRHREVGFSANGMAVWRVPDEHIEEAGRLAAEAPEVSHCYQRPCSEAWPYNLYTMIHARSEEACQLIIDLIRQSLAPLGVSDQRTLYSSTEFKKQRVKYFIDE